MLKKILLTAVLTSALFAGMDLSKIADCVDGEKAMGSIKTEKAIAAASKGTDLTMEDVTNSVDGEKAIDSIDGAKLSKSLGL